MTITFLPCIFLQTNIDPLTQHISIRRDQIMDDIEITILSRELPDRLLLFRNIVHDPQVGAAVSVLRDSIRHSDAFSNAVHDACVIPGKADDLIATCINDKLVTGSGVVDQYDTLLAGPKQTPQ